MLRSRDVQRRNKANKAVQACLLSKLASDSIKLLRTRSTFNSSDNANCLSLLQVAEDTNVMMIDYFCKSQSSINKATCKKYARSQHSLILRAMKNNEPISSISGISEYIIDDNITRAYRDYHNLLCKLYVFCFPTPFPKILDSSHFFYP